MAEPPQSREAVIATLQRLFAEYDGWWHTGPQQVVTEERMRAWVREFVGSTRDLVALVQSSPEELRMTPEFAVAVTEYLRGCGIDIPSAGMVQSALVAASTVSDGRQE